MEKNANVPAIIKITALENYLTALNAKVWQDNKSTFWKLLFFYLISKYIFIDTLAQQPVLCTMLRWVLVFVITTELIVMLTVIIQNYMVKRQIFLIKNGEIKGG